MKYFNFLRLSGQRLPQQGQVVTVQWCTPFYSVRNNVVDGSIKSECKNYRRNKLVNFSEQIDRQRENKNKRE